ncbi:MAG: dTMP kinase [archaeon]|nr:MAG: dTMP kinase [archaeon]
MEGKFIVFEGIDGSGKSTQFKLFCEKLKKRREILETREPTRDLIGNLITRRLKTETILPGHANGLIYTLLFYADRIEHNNMINRELEKGKTVVSDRYYHSTLAYQRTQGFDTGFILDLHRKLVEKGYVRVPDITFFIDLPAEEALKRIDSRKEKEKVHIFEHTEFLRKLRENYLKLKDLPEENIQVIDGTGTVEQVQKRVWDRFSLKG